jgi:hypothetical protein
MSEIKPVSAVKVLLITENTHSEWACEKFKKERQAYLKQAELLLITDLVKQSRAATINTERTEC